MYINVSDEFKRLVKERSEKENTTISKYIIDRIADTWEKEGLSIDRKSLYPIKKSPNYSKTYEKDGIICTKKYDYDFCSRVMEMYRNGQSTLSIANELGYHQKTIWRIIDRNLNKGGE